MKDPLKDITAVTVNWLTAERTLRAVKAFKQFYPNIPLIVVDDDSNIKHKQEFASCYGKYWELEYDPCTSKLKEYLLQFPPHDLHPKGHGYALDYGVKHINTRWVFQFHSDYRMLKPGILEELTNDLNENICAAGGRENKSHLFEATIQAATLYNVELGKKHNLYFKPIIYHNDGHIAPFPGKANGGKAIPCGEYYTGRLCQLGYKIKYIPFIHKKYGIHLKIENIESEVEWKKYF